MTVNYPLARKQSDAVTFGRIRYADDYRWLEEDTPEAMAWQSEQDRLTQGWFASSPATARAQALTAAIPRVVSEFPIYSGGRWFRRRTPDGQTMPMAEVAERLDGAWHCIVDLNVESKGRLLTIDVFVPSPDGRKLVLGWGIDGRELAELRVFEVDTGKVLLESLRQVYAFFPAWLPDSSGFYYTAREPELATPQLLIFRQQLGAEPVSQREDYELSHSMAWVKPAGDGKHLFIVADHLNPRPEYIRDATTDDGWRPFLKGETALFRGEVIGGHFYAVTDDGAPCGRVVAIPLATPGDRSSWKELIPGSDKVLGTLLAIDGQLVLVDLDDCYSRLRVFGTDGRFRSEIPLPGRGSVSIIQFAMYNMLDAFWKGANGDVLFPFSAPVQSPALYRANVHTLDIEELIPPQFEIAAQTRDYAATSADGARVLYNLVARADVDLTKPQPTAMYGYGGFSAALLPAWAGTYLAGWVQAGGVLVLMHLRGGGELGPDMWHQGRLQHKQNSFNDVYAIAEDLIARGHTTAAQLGVVGGSNGGTMAATVAVQRPELFRASVSQCPVTDVLGRARDPICMGATLDYGDPNDLEMSEVLAAWSPYQNVKDGNAYPALLLDAGAMDVRCPPWHVRKLAARMQPANMSPHPILMRVREGVGHGASDVEGQRLQGADWLAFLIDQLGLKP